MIQSQADPRKRPCGATPFLLGEYFGGAMALCSAFLIGVAVPVVLDDFSLTGLCIVVMLLLWSAVAIFRRKDL